MQLTLSELSSFLMIEGRRDFDPADEKQVIEQLLALRQEHIADLGKYVVARRPRDPSSPENEGEDAGGEADDERFRGELALIPGSELRDVFPSVRSEKRKDRGDLPPSREPPRVDEEDTPPRKCSRVDLPESDPLISSPSPEFWELLSSTAQVQTIMSYEDFVRSMPQPHAAPDPPE